MPHHRGERGRRSEGPGRREGPRVNALVVFLGNFGPETPETLLCQKFDGPTMYVAAAEGDGDLINGRGDAYCGVLNCSYNLAAPPEGLPAEYP